MSAAEEGGGVMERDLVRTVSEKKGFLEEKV